MESGNTRIAADEVIENTLANWPRTVAAARLRAELAAAGFKILPREPPHVLPGDRIENEIWRSIWDSAP